MTVESNRYVSGSRYGDKDDYITKGNGRPETDNKGQGGPGRVIMELMRE